MRIITFLLFMILLAGCQSMDQKTVKETGEMKSPPTSVNAGSDKSLKKSGCPDAVIDYTDALMIQDIVYEHHFPDQADESIKPVIEKGKELGEVDFKMADQACSDHRMKDGDATYLEEGTKIYEIKGYPVSLMVFANDKVFVVDRNENAKTAGELYPLDGFVKQIHLESTEDGSRIHTFSSSSVERFVDSWKSLKLGDPQALSLEGKFEGERIFLEFELKNGVSFRQVYWRDSNTFRNGAVGTKPIQEIILEELSKIDQ